MGPFSLLSIGVFVALIVLVLESNVARAVLGGIAVLSWLLFGMIGATVVCSVLSVGILIADKMPTISKL